MAVPREHYSIALRAAERIRAHWRKFKEEFYRTNSANYPYEEVEVKVMPFSYEIVSNLVGGYPPLRSA